MTPISTWAGYVLTGGRSTRMGRDKALLPFGHRYLVDHVAAAAAAAAGSVTLVGAPERYAALGYPVIPDDVAGAGPLAGIAAALAHTSAPWNLVLACDMPLIARDFLVRLQRKAEHAGYDCVLPVGRSGLPEPLCAAYHRRCLATISSALAAGTRKVTEGLSGLRVHLWAVDEEEVFRNCNTPGQWDALDSP